MYAPCNTYIRSEWVVKSDLPLAFETTKIQRPVSGQCLTIVFALLNSRVPRGRKSVMVHTAVSGLTARSSEAAAPGALDLEYEQGMQANPTEGFQGENDSGTETAHAHSSRICACTHPRMRTDVHARTPSRAHIHARKPVCTDAHTNTHVRASRYMHASLPGKYGNWLALGKNEHCVL